MDAAAAYRQGRETRAREVAALDARARGLSTARLAVAAIALGLLVAIGFAHLGKAGWLGLAAAAGVFVVLVIVHAGVLDARERSAAALRFHERGLARLAHAWDGLPATSARFRRAEHSFANDLDVFGRASIMQLVDATETLLGERRLAELLSLEDPGRWPDDARGRQQAVRDLAARATFRERLAVAGGVLADERPDPAGLIAWAEASDGLPAGLALLGWVVPAAVAASALGVAALHLRAEIISLFVLGAIAVGVLAGGRLTPMLSAATVRESALTRWRAMIAAIEAEPFEALELVRLRESLATGGRLASEEIAALERIVGFVGARDNEVFRLLIGPLLMWDVHCARALLRWRARAGGRVRAWLEALGELEALASLGGFAFEQPGFAWPELVPEPVFEAKGLGHPLIAEAERVGNDVLLPAAGHALVVTGSNMSGKSTLLRAIGVNAVLAVAGAPVCARAARLGPARVATSMRVDDSLERGVSHFYAEVQRLKRVLDLAAERGRPPVLFLLDEILHGTNSRERVLGACAVVRELLARGALGAVSTHDVGITALEQELGGAVRNVHFEEQVTGREMTFDYVLRPGVVRSSNALRLMRAVGIDVGGAGAPPRDETEG